MITKQREVFNTAWTIMKKYENLQQNGEDWRWEEFHKETKALAEMGNFDPEFYRFTRMLALTVVNFIETASKHPELARLAG